MYTPFRDTGSEAVTGGRYRTRHFGILGYVTARPDSIESFKMTKLYQGRVASIGNVKSPYHMRHVYHGVPPAHDEYEYPT